MDNQISQQEEERYAQLQLMALDFARNGETQELKKMLDYGMSPNLCTHKGDSLVMLAAYRGHHETTQMLIKSGADVNKVNARGQTPLDGVCFKGNLEIVKLLVQNGANIEGNPILFATIFGHSDIVDYLKLQGVNKKSLKILGIRVEGISRRIAALKALFQILKKRTFKSAKSLG